MQSEILLWRTGGSVAAHTRADIPGQGGQFNQQPFELGGIHVSGEGLLTGPQPGKLLEEHLSPTVLRHCIRFIYEGFLGEGSI